MWNDVHEKRKRKDTVFLHTVIIAVENQREEEWTDLEVDGGEVGWGIQRCSEVCGLICYVGGSSCYWESRWQKRSRERWGEDP